MPITESLENCFKPEERKRGEDLFAKGIVALSSASDTDVRALVKASGAPRVTLESTDVASPSFSARCSCTAGGKGVLCKHVWATLLALDAREADFLNEKVETEAVGRDNSAKLAAQAKRSEYAKEKRRSLKAARKEAEAPCATPSTIYPEPVDEALAYFGRNGFELAADLEMARVLDAKRLLARVFHPDKGGSHDEAIELNHNFEVLREYLNG